MPAARRCWSACAWCITFSRRLRWRRCRRRAGARIGRHGGDAATCARGSISGAHCRPRGTHVAMHDLHPVAGPVLPREATGARRAGTGRPCLCRRGVGLGSLPLSAFWHTAMAASSRAPSLKRGRRTGASRGCGAGSRFPGVDGEAPRAMGSVSALGLSTSPCGLTAEGGRCVDDAGTRHPRPSRSSGTLASPRAVGPCGLFRAVYSCSGGTPPIRPVPTRRPWRGSAPCAPGPSASVRSSTLTKAERRESVGG